MSKLDKILVEALLFKDKPPTEKKSKKAITMKEYIKFKKEFDEFQKLLKEEADKNKPKDDKKKDELTFWQKTALLHIGALGYFATLALLFRLTFH